MIAVKPTEPAVGIGSAPCLERAWSSEGTAPDRPGVRRPRGFSLIELLVTIAIIALLASFLIYAAAGVWKFVHKVIDMAQG